MIALEIPPDALAAIVAHCRATLPEEACGLAGRLPNSETVRSVYPLINAKASPTEYESDSRSLLAAFRSMRERGEELALIYHSHPNHAPSPSRRDRERNHYGEIPHLIVSLRGEEPEVRLWRLEPEVTELAWSPPPKAGSAAGHC